MWIYLIYRTLYLYCVCDWRASVAIEARLCLGVVCWQGSVYKSLHTLNLFCLLLTTIYSRHLKSRSTSDLPTKTVNLTPTRAATRKFKFVSPLDCGLHVGYSCYGSDTGRGEPANKGKPGIGTKKVRITTVLWTRTDFKRTGRAATDAHGRKDGSREGHGWHSYSA